MEQAEALLNQADQVGVNGEEAELESGELSYDDMIAKIKSLHPPRDDRDDLPGISSNPIHSLVVERRVVEDVVRGLHANTSEGPDGWSANVLKHIFREADDMLQGATENDDLIGRLQKVINRIAAGLMPPEVRYCLIRLKSILIPKFDAGGIHIWLSSSRYYGKHSSVNSSGGCHKCGSTSQGLPLPSPSSGRH